MLDNFLIRTADVVISLIALLFLGIPMIAIALLIRMDDRGPAFFVQQRVGRGGRNFNIYKFRSMRVSPVAFAGEPAAMTREEKAEARKQFQTTKDNDPRITRMGRILRPSHLDELPQLLNVLAGDMSIVGVRPDTPVQEVDYSPEYWSRRHRLRPGITGPAQLESNVATLEKRSALEETWIASPRLSTYLMIQLKTVYKVLARTGN